MVRLYQAELSMPWRFVADPERQLYGKFDMRSGPWTRILGWTAMKTYLDLVFRKRRAVKRPSSMDFQQLGGNVLIDPSGIVRLHFQSQNPADRPSVDSLLSLVDSTATQQTG